MGSSLPFWDWMTVRTEEIPGYPDDINPSSKTITLVVAVFLFNFFYTIEGTTPLVFF
jgi:hypothetical protein